MSVCNCGDWKLLDRQSTRQPVRLEWQTCRSCGRNRWYKLYRKERLIAEGQVAREVFQQVISM